MLNKLLSNSKKKISFFFKVFTLASILISQSFVTEIFLRQNGELVGSQANATPAWEYYQFHKTITIDHTKVANTDQANFPVLVSLTDNDLKTVANGGEVYSSSGRDINFLDSNGDQLAYEIESYDGSTGTIKAWVKVPTLSHTTDTSIYIYYSSEYMSSQENKTGVWDSSYAGVWHLKETGTATVGDYKDSTSNANNNNSTVTQPTVTSSGKIANAQSYDGTDDYIGIAGSSSLNIAGAITLEGWVYPTTSDGDILRKVRVGEGYMLYIRSNQRISIGVNEYGNEILTDNNAISLNTWNHVVATVDGNGNVNIYVNGTNVKSATASVLNSSSYNPQLILGGSSWTSGNFLNGTLDEVRISATNRSADWIATEYNNQNSPSTFYSVGNEEYVPIVDAPVISPSDDSWEDIDTQLVLTMSTTTPGASIYYTINGHDPILYTGPTPLTDQYAEVRAQAVKNGMADSYYSETKTYWNNYLLQPINITNNLSQALSGYQVKLTVDSTDAYYNSCASLRFKESDGTNIPYWIESGCGTSSTVVWVKTDLPASGSKTINMYSGNPYLYPASNADDVFIVFDNFDAANSTKWTSANTSNASINFTDSAAELSSLATVGQYASLTYNTGLDLANTVTTFHYASKYADNSGRHDGAMWSGLNMNHGGTSHEAGTYMYAWGNVNNLLHMNTYGDSVAVTSSYSSPVKADLIYDGSQVILKKNDTQVYSSSFTTPSSSTLSLKAYGGDPNPYGRIYTKFYDVYVHKYASVEPSVSYE